MSNQLPWRNLYGSLKILFIQQHKRKLLKQFFFINLKHEAMDRALQKETGNIKQLD